MMNNNVKCIILWYAKCNTCTNTYESADVVDIHDSLFQDILLCGLSGGMFSGLLTASAILHRNLFDDCSKLNNQIRKKEKTAQAAQNGTSQKKQD